MTKGSSLGILGDKGGCVHVPGSILLICPDTEITQQDGLKKSKGQDGVILDPQPDDTRSDPLNWPTWRRECALLAVGFYSLLGGGQAPILAAGFPNVAQTYRITSSEVAFTTAAFVAGLAIGVITISPFASMYGKRPLFLAGAVIFCASSAWAAASPSYASLTVARVVMGIGVSPCECLASAYLAEIFFLHERGFRLGIYTLLLLGGKNLVPLLSGAIIQGLGWRWVFWIMTALSGALVFLVLLFVPEACWFRGVKLLHSIPAPSELSELDNPKPHILVYEGSNGSDTGISEEKDPATPTENEKATTTTPSLVQRSPPQLFILKYTQHGPQTSFKSQLSIYSGRIQQGSYIRALARPMILLTYPAILWSTVVYALSVLWLIIMSESVAHIYQHRPYHFTRLQTGLVYTAPFVGGILGSAPAGKISDLIVRYMAEKNGGVYEPYVS
ncbi:hypothetical protein TWF730_003625 [Orbilia blumenaviensis]|uniref:Major facilitator superfamily (MFS) profile domain-containing protein n=1 Tax=Orbilia blumenaviensis TaxID=1796055 RepID=A0AAV9U3K9_9PEZI